MSRNRKRPARHPALRGIPENVVRRAPASFAPEMKALWSRAYVLTMQGQSGYDVSQQLLGRDNTSGERRRAVEGGSAAAKSERSQASAGPAPVISSIPSRPAASPSWLHILSPGQFSPGQFSDLVRGLDGIWYPGRGL